MSDDEKSLLLLTSEDRDYWLNRAVYHEEQRNTAEAERDAARADAERLAAALIALLNVGLDGRFYPAAVVACEKALVQHVLVEEG